MASWEGFSNYQCVGQFHEVFGHPKPASLQKNVFVENPKLVQFRLSLIREEYLELKTAVEENNKIEVVDALGDILYVVYGMGQALGIDLDKFFRVFDENDILTNFQYVGHIHKTFGYDVDNITKINSLQEEPLVQYCVTRIGKKFSKLESSVEQQNMLNVINSLREILCVVYDMGHSLSINLDKAFKLVHESNMSKLCNNETEAIETISYYKTLPGFESTDVRYRLSTDGKYYVIYNFETGKILKSKYFKLPDFSSIMN